MKSSDLHAQITLAVQFQTEELKRKMKPIGEKIASAMLKARVFIMSFDAAQWDVPPKDVADYLRTLGYTVKFESNRNETYITVTVNP